MFPSFAVATGIGFRRVWEARGQSLRVATVTFLALLFGVGAWQPARAIRRWGQLITGQMSRTDYWADFQYHPPTAGNDIETAEWIRAHSTDADRIALWGANPGIIYLSGRASASRFGFPEPLVGRPSHPIAPSFQAEFARAIRDVKPKFIVASDYDGPGGQTIERHGLYPELIEPLAANYQLELRIGLFQIFRLKQDRH